MRRSGRHLLPSCSYICPVVTAQSGSSSVRSPGTREGMSGSLRPAGAEQGAGRAPPAGWYGPRCGSRDQRALGGDPGWPRAEPPKQPGRGPGPGGRSGDGAGGCRRNELRHRLPQGPFPGLPPASGRCRVLRRLGATSPLETQHALSVLIP